MKKCPKCGRREVNEKGRACNACESEKKAGVSKGAIATGGLLAALATAVKSPQAKQIAKKAGVGILALLIKR